MSYYNALYVMLIREAKERMLNHDGPIKSVVEKAQQLLPDHMFNAFLDEIEQMEFYAPVDYNELDIAII